MIFILIFILFIPGGKLLDEKNFHFNFLEGIYDQTIWHLFHQEIFKIIVQNMVDGQWLFPPSGFPPNLFESIPELASLKTSVVI